MHFYRFQVGELWGKKGGGRKSPSVGGASKLCKTKQNKLGSRGKNEKDIIQKSTKYTIKAHSF